MSEELTCPRIEVDLLIYKASDGRESVLKSEEEIKFRIERNDRQIERLKKRAEGAPIMDRMFYEGEMDRWDEDTFLQKEYLDNLPEMRNAAKPIKFWLLVPEYGNYINWQNQARNKQANGSPGDIDDVKLMDLCLPHCIAKPSNDNPDGFEKLLEAKARALPPHYFPELWRRLYMGINPDRSALPFTLFPS